MSESPCFPAARVLVGRAESRHTCQGAGGTPEDDGSGGGGMGSEPVVKREWKAEPGHIECSGTSNLRLKRGRDREVGHEVMREGHNLGLRNLMDMDSVQNVCKD